VDIKHSDRFWAGFEVMLDVLMVLMFWPVYLLGWMVERIKDGRNYHQRKHDQEVEFLDELFEQEGTAGTAKAVGNSGMDDYNDGRNKDV